MARHMQLEHNPWTYQQDGSYVLEDATGLMRGRVWPLYKPALEGGRTVRGWAWGTAFPAFLGTEDKLATAKLRLARHVGLL